MLELHNIQKEYASGDNKVVALKGIDLQFRHSEFVSILGQSGCGKTTMLNIIGGLDQYTAGDLVINGKSTKDFKDRDWDTYRNNSVGFVFQTYNLIPHQTVLRNVELALTLSGVGKSERKARATEALKEVGLGDQLSKRPNQLSGGQMQRVAIARALVNNPDIILADEPTGALDTETSVQVMEILKKISSDRLIVMVTHNPDLAKTYSSRIINMLDGRITNDSLPITAEERETEKANDKKQPQNVKKPSMSFGTSFGLSLKNLFTKKGRTTLTAFAGSIGILGISLILAVSQGTTNYIDEQQEAALTAYPLSIEASTIDLMSLMNTFMNINHADVEHGTDAIYEKSAVYDMLNALSNIDETKNDLKAFKAYIEKELATEGSALSEAVSGVQYSYNLDLLVYTENVDGTVIRSDTQELLRGLITEYMGMESDMVTPPDMLSMSSSPLASLAPSGGMMSMAPGLWQELLTGNNGEPLNKLLSKQYDVIYGEWADEYNEIVIVVDSNNELDDITLYALGLLPKEDITELMHAAADGKTVEKSTKQWNYDEIVGMTFKTILSADCFSLDEETGLYTDLRDTDAGIRYLYDNGLPLKVTGIIRKNPDSDAAMLSGTIGYTHALTEYLINKADNAEVVKAQRADEATDILTGLPFKSTAGELSAEEKEQDLRDYLNDLDDEGKAEAYVAMVSIPSDDFLKEQADKMIGNMSREEMEATISQGLTSQMSVNADDIAKYLSSMGDDEMRNLFGQMANEQIKAQYAEGVRAQMGTMSSQQLNYALANALKDYTPEQFSAYYDEIMQFSSSTYEDNLVKIGGLDLDSPSTVNIYSASFDSKDTVTDAIASYNKTVEDVQQIHFTDYIGLMMSSVTMIINAITYVLIAFVAISLVVSSIMIGVITLISVQERTKEIGILRAIGASKRDVSSMFNAETMIIGFASGVIGVAVAWVLCIPINLIIHELTGINNLNAYLPPIAALVLVAISVLLTLIAGIIPSGSAAKKDPVVALRTE
jgi:putative ABC transport system permease protein